jgi:hypothetical protein
MHIDGTIPHLNKPKWNEIAFKLKHKEEISKTEGKGTRQQIEGKSLSKLSKNPDKIELNNGKFTIDMEKLRRNILSVTYQSYRALIPSF